eukprot:TRINITY_DN12045_c0_g1_i1.p1 TRINITY_DN12045_c0_g1~~TRINITY_DN12045_c0_g1_i1.p1  ORF type:complete len:362 (-),score=75.53 TRINITY_DN12045_c0_g1_i1:45-1082(-)
MCIRDRFTVSWARVEPRKAEVSTEALEYYSGAVDDMIAQGITPVLTLLGSTLPEWVEKSGGLLQESNIQALVDHSVMMFERLRGRVNYWVTLDDPVEMVLQQQRHSSLKDTECCELLGQLMAAHVRIYAALKAKVGGPRSQVGIVVQVVQCSGSRWWHPGDWRAASRMQQAVSAPIDLLQSGSMLSCFGSATQALNNPGAMRSSDFVGLAYFSRRTVLSGDRFSCLEAELLTDSGVPCFPEGLYFALKALEPLKLPLMVATHGVSDKADALRLLFLRRSMYALSKAVAEGCPVLGYFCCSVYDDEDVRGVGVVQPDCGMYRAGATEPKNSVRYLGHLINNLRTAR